MRLKMGYPTVEEGIEILKRFKGPDLLPALEAVASDSSVIDAQASISAATVSDAIERYIIDIIEATRHDEKIVLGISPRGSIALMKAAQAAAIFDGRSYVIPDDVKKVAVPVLAHRLILKGHAIAGGAENAENTVGEILKRVPVPIEEI